MNAPPRVVVYGATGHTARFVIDAALAQGWSIVLVARRALTAEDLPERHRSLPRRRAVVTDHASLRAAFADADVVLNCAGPFLDTALPVARAAIAVGAHYVDLAAEQAAVLNVYGDLDEPAKARGVVLVPGAAFFGGLADLMVTALTGGRGPVDEVTIAMWLDHWWPTPGTRATGRRNTAARVVVRGGGLEPLTLPAARRTWVFPDRWGERPVTAMPLSEVVTILRHLDVGRLDSWLCDEALADLDDPRTPAPTAVDGTGRSAQEFVIEVVARCESWTGRILASGRDVYAVSAPLMVAVASRLITDPPLLQGCRAPGELVDAAATLGALTDIEVRGPVTR